MLEDPPRSDRPPIPALRVLFIGRDNPFNRGIAKCLEQEFELVGCFFIEPDRFKLKTRWKLLRKRAARYGWFPVIDQFAFHLFSRLLRWYGREPEIWKRKAPVIFVEKMELKSPCWTVEDVHQEKWQNKLRELNVQAAVSVCGSVIFREEFYSIPFCGTFIIHEGLTPEYKGLHTPIWALMRNETQFLGCTFLRANDSIDGGDVIMQKRYVIADDEGILNWGFVGHNAILTALPEMTKALRQLAAEGNFTPVNMEDRISKYYTWMSLTKFMGHLLKNWRYLQWGRRS